MKRVQTETADLLERNRAAAWLLLLLFDASALMKAGVWTISLSREDNWKLASIVSARNRTFKNVLIHDDYIHIGAFNSSRAITRCAGYTKTSVCTNSWRVERSVYLGSWHYKRSRWCYIKSCSHRLSLADHWPQWAERLFLSVRCRVSHTLTCTKIVRQFKLIENALHSLIL